MNWRVWTTRRRACRAGGDPLDMDRPSPGGGYGLVAPGPGAEGADQVFSCHWDRGTGSTDGGQSVKFCGLRARVVIWVIWPPLRLAQLRCERGSSVSVVWPAGSRALLLSCRRQR